MSLEDPFFVVKDEVMRALTKTRALHDSWQEGREGRSPEEQDWSATELKNSLRSIEWDLEDLEDTVQIVEKNPSKFKIDSGEIAVRRGFIEKTREEVRNMKERITNPMQGDRLQEVLHKPGQASPGPVPNSGHSKYSRVPTQEDEPHRDGFIRNLEQQQEVMKRQDETMDLMADSMGNIRDMSHTIGNELDEQAVMLDEFGAEIEHADSRLDATMKKMAKVLHLSDDRRQWWAIGILSSATVVVLLLLLIF